MVLFFFAENNSPIVKRKLEYQTNSINGRMPQQCGDASSKLVILFLFFRGKNLSYNEINIILKRRSKCSEHYILCGVQDRSL